MGQVYLNQIQCDELAPMYYECIQMQAITDSDDDDANSIIDEALGDIGKIDNMTGAASKLVQGTAKAYEDGDELFTNGAILRAIASRFVKYGSNARRGNVSAGPIRIALGRWELTNQGIDNASQKVLADRLGIGVQALQKRIGAAMTKGQNLKALNKTLVAAKIARGDVRAGYKILSSIIKGAPYIGAGFTAVDAGVYGSSVKGSSKYSQGMGGTSLGFGVLSAVTAFIPGLQPLAVVAGIDAGVTGMASLA